MQQPRARRRPAGRIGADPPHPPPRAALSREIAMAKTRKPVLGGHERVKVAIAQISSAYLDREASIGRAVAAIGEAARNGAQLVVFSEVWLAGYPFWSEGWDSNLPEWVQGRVAFRDAAILVPS